MGRDYSRWLEDTSNPDVKEFVEGGGYGTFAGWTDGGFMTSNTDGRPPGGSYFKDGKYFTVSGTDGRMVPPDYELIGIDEAVVEGDVGAMHATPGRMILKRRQQAPAPTPTPAPAASPSPSATPKPPAGRVDASTPSLANALRSQGRRGSVLQGVLDSGLQLNGWKDAGRGDAMPVRSQEAGDDGRRFAASARWRQRMDEVAGRFA